MTRARQRLVTEAKSNGIVLRQNYNRNVRELVCQQSRCSCLTDEAGSGLYQKIKDVSWSCHPGYPTKMQLRR
jgi:hypothetical protein